MRHRQADLRHVSPGSPESIWADHPEELKEHFGRQVRTRVAEVTDDKNLPKEERKRLQ
jgi:hypothetical protein